MTEGVVVFDLFMYIHILACIGILGHRDKIRNLYMCLYTCTCTRMKLYSVYTD